MSWDLFLLIIGSHYKKKEFSIITEKSIDTGGRKSCVQHGGENCAEAQAVVIDAGGH